jgi:hypothetical protein
MNELHKSGTLPERRELKKGLRLQIDDPENRRITQPSGVIRGWFAALDCELPETFEFRIDGIVLPHKMVAREDVEESMPDHLIAGFDIPYDLVPYLPYIQDRRLIVHLKLPDFDSIALRFKIEESALASCLADAGGV